MSTDFRGKRFVTALSFLTIFPLAEQEDDAVGSLAYFPLVGFLLGCLLWACGDQCPVHRIDFDHRYTGAFPR